METVAFQILRAKLKKGEKAAVFIGAGCSKTAGIPVAGEFEAIIKSDFADAAALAKSGTYIDLMNCLDLREQQKLIIERMTGPQVRLNPAHLALAALIKQKRVDRVVTTNFDLLLPQACALVGVDVACYGIDAVLAPDCEVIDIGMPALFYIHGQAHGYKRLVDKFPADHRTRMQYLFERLAQTRPFVVVGYSGANDPTAEALENIEYRGSLFWVYHNDVPPSTDVQIKILNKDHTHKILGFDADRFFTSLADGLDCPSTIDPLRKPFSFLKETIERLTPGESADGLSLHLVQKGKIRQAIQAYESDENGAHPPEIGEPHRGLIVTLPTFSCMRGENGYETGKLLSDSVGQPDFRYRAFQTNWGPLLVALDHHDTRLEHLWILCTEAAGQQYEEFQSIVNHPARRTTFKNAVECHRVDIKEMNNVLEVEKEVRRIYDNKGPDLGLIASEIMGDITSGLATMTAGIVLAAAPRGYPVEYISQLSALVEDGRALSLGEIRARQILVPIWTSGAVAGAR